MDGFVRITDGQAIIRKPKGVCQQVPIYHRLGRVYIGAAGGFVRVGTKFGDTYGTSHPDIHVLDLEGENVRLSGDKHPVFGGWSK